MRYFIEFSYNGKNYAGWQIQPNAISVQEIFENALSTVLRVPIKLTASGRTDTGVHARQQFAHFDFEQELDRELIFKLNSFLPNGIAVQNIKMVKDNAHARFDAKLRQYEYYINFEKNPFLEDFSYFIRQKPDIILMKSAAKNLLGHKDFKCFSRSKTDVKTYYCTIEKVDFELTETQLVFTIAADRFLRNMVRAIVGTLLDVGYGKITLVQFQTILGSGDRSMAGTSVPAHGLYLSKVIYPKSIFKISSE